MDRLVVGGVLQRFCQQCGRFHVLGEPARLPVCRGPSCAHPPPMWECRLWQERKRGYGTALQPASQLLPPQMAQARFHSLPHPHSHPKPQPSFSSPTFKPPLPAAEFEGTKKSCVRKLRLHNQQRLQGTRKVLCVVATCCFFARQLACAGAPGYTLLACKHALPALTSQPIAHFLPETAVLAPTPTPWVALSAGSCRGWRRSGTAAAAPSCGQGPPGWPLAAPAVHSRVQQGPYEWTRLCPGKRKPRRSFSSRHKWTGRDRRLLGRGANTPASCSGGGGWTEAHSAWNAGQDGPRDHAGGSGAATCRYTLGAFSDPPCRPRSCAAAAGESSGALSSPTRSCSTRSPPATFFCWQPDDSCCGGSHF